MPLPLFAAQNLRTCSIHGFAIVFYYNRLKKEMPEKKKYGTRLEVWRGKAAQTTGGLSKAALTKNRNGKIVSKKKSVAAKRNSHLGNMVTDTNRKKRTSKLTDLSDKNIRKGKRKRKRPVRYSSSGNK